MSIKASILFGLTLIDEVMREFRDPGGFLSFSYENLYGFVPSSYKRRNLYSIVNSLKTNNDITAIERGNFQLTIKGQKEVISHFPRLKFINQPWDGKWRIVGFDVKEKERNIRNVLRESLKLSGFGMLQRSLYISPLPVESLVEEFLLSNRDKLENTYIFVSDKFFLENREDMIDKVFHIKELNSVYSKILERLRLEKEDRQDIFREFVKASIDDPFLPQEILPKSFVRQKVWRELGFRKIAI
jgi:DNA-binding transcriptional regulator PaaX